MMLELFQYDQPPERQGRPPRNCDCGGHHIAFKVENLEEFWPVWYLARRVLLTMRIMRSACS